MRPQFSILAILLLTAYMAVLAAAIVDIDSFWVAIAIYSLPLAFLVACGFAIFGREGRRAFARGFVVGCLIHYGLMVIWPDNVMPPPYEWIAKAMPLPPPPDRFFGEFGQHFTVMICIFAQCTLASGVLGGALTLWLYRHREAQRLQRGTDESLNRE